jgi:acetolactate decarboxylase
MSSKDDPLSPLLIALSQTIADRVHEHCQVTGLSTRFVLISALQKYLQAGTKGNAAYLSAPVTSLMKGYYEQDTLIGDLKRHGDFGLGTFNGLDGEMAMLEGKVYQLSADGFAYDVDNKIQTPFACVTFFSPDIEEEIDGDFDHNAFSTILDRLILSPNMLFALRIDGRFNHIRVWSVSKQENYQPMVETDEARPTFEYRDVDGTLAGFYTPRFIRSLSMPGFHLHFLTSDRKRGGHLHECSVKKATIGLQLVPRLTLNMPKTLDYLTATLPR